MQYAVYSMQYIVCSMQYSGVDTKKCQYTSIYTLLGGLLENFRLPAN